MNDPRVDTSATTARLWADFIALLVLLGLVLVGWLWLEGWL